MTIGNPTMLKVGGKFQRCPECGANVFTHIQEKPRNKYECNGCGAHFVDGGEDGAVSAGTHKRLTGRIVLEFTICLPIAEAEETDSIVDHVVSDDSTWNDVTLDLESIEEYTP